MTRSIHPVTRRAFVAGALAAPAMVACDPRPAQPTTPPQEAAMITVRPALERFHTRIGWLDSWHSFSFGHHQDPAHMGFGVLRVINEDRVMAGQGFATHGHKDMEIVSYVVDGALGHKDSMGNGSTIVPGDIQRMSAGTGVMHSEMNPQKDKPVHFLQIWLLPKSRGIAPGYAQEHFSADTRRDRLRLVASDTPRDGAIAIHSDVDLYASLLSKGRSVEVPLTRAGRGWVQLVKGHVDVADGSDTVRLGPGDGAAIVGSRVALSASEDAELLVFDLGLPA
jgi:quercetin 2,3-dioxygenase